jgi:1-carboxybiuret hydrolase subunit AtzG-like
MKGEKLVNRPFDVAACVDAAAALIELPLDPAHRPGVILNLQRIAEMAALVMAFPLPDDVEPAPVFLP